MERLEVKRINGKSYYYYSKWGKVKGKCRRLWQRYLGTAESLLEKIKGNEKQQTPLYAEVFQYGLPVALWKECQNARVIETTDKICKKRNQGLSVGNYIAIAAINRAFNAVSKLGMWEWFSQTSLLRLFPKITTDDMTSQQFWNHMDMIDAESCKQIWEQLISHVVANEKIDLSSVSYDGTNFYTFIDTFNVRCSLAKRGKNKQGRANLRQISYSLFCTADGHIPLLYDVYEGNRVDVTQFPMALERFQKFFEKLSNSQLVKEKTTLIFDKGNCSKENYKEIDKSEFYFVTSAKLDEHKELVKVLNNDKRFTECIGSLEGTKALRTKKRIFEKDRTVVISYSQNLFNTQSLTLHADINKAVEKLNELSSKLEDRINGIIRSGKAPSQASIEKQCDEIFSREYLKEIIKITITPGPVPRLSYVFSQDALKNISDTYLGKNIIITNRETWTDSEIITAYRSQYIIEDVFKEAKDRKYGSWWPQYHWTDSKIHVHGLYCTIALLLRAIMWRRISKAGVRISMKRLLTELDGIREVVNVYKGKKCSETVLTKLSETQEALADILEVSKKM